MHDLTGFQRDILYIIASSDDQTGLEIKEHLDQYYEDEINHGRLYPNLDKLVEKGLVDKGDRDDRSHYYRLASRESPELEARQEWEKITSKIN